MLKMKKSCERCNVSLQDDGEAYICSFECTFCKTCTEAMSCVCPNCAGQLLQRPARVRKVADVAISQVKTKLGRLLGN